MMSAIPDNRPRSHRALYRNRTLLRKWNVAQDNKNQSSIQLAYSSYFPPQAIKSSPMFKGYLSIAWRNLTKNKVFSLINILGLTIGMTVCMLIFLYVLNEFSMDNFHPDGKNIYRVMRNFERDGKESKVSYLSGTYAPAFMNDFKGEIKNAVRINQNDNLVTIGNNSFHEMKILDVDSNFFSIFQFPMLRGNKHTALNDPSSAVLTETTARRYFGSVDNAMGKMIMVDKRMPLTVTAIMKDVPANSHLEFNVLIPLSNYRTQSWMTTWINNGVYTYVELYPNVTQAQVEKQFPAFMEKYMGADMRKFGFKFTLDLTPLKDIYFQQAAFDNVRHGDKTVVYLFLSIGALILLIACINFMNLSTIRAADRSKEVGLRKVLGALRKNLIWQFIGESVLLTLISCLLSIGLLMLVMPSFNRFLGYSISTSLNLAPIGLFMAGMILVVGFLAGSYPAFVLSAFKPIQALKGKLKTGKGGSLFRQSLVVFQFSCSVFLIVGTIVMTKQLRFVKNKKLGYDSEQTIAVPIDNNDIYVHMNTFKSNLEHSPSVQSVSNMSGEPGGYHDMHMFDVEGQTDRFSARTEFADFEYVPTLGLKLIAGRNFSSSFPSDTMASVLINHTAASKLGWTPQDAIGKWIHNTVRDSLRRQVIGVIEDYNFLSLKENIEPLVISPAEDRRVSLIKLKPGQLEAGIAAIQKEYDAAAPGYPMEYRFVDKQFDKLYRNDVRQQTILSIFSGLAIFIACLGLFALASFTTTKRIKEIGVRKVLGSSVRGIVVLLSRDLLKPVLIATCIALPLGYYVMNRWLQNFAYKTSLDWWILVGAAMLTFGIAFVTVSLKAVKAAVANPVKSLRTE